MSATAVDLRRALRRYLITDARAGSVERLVALSEAALAGGMTAVQLRAKGYSDRQLLAAALRLREACARHGALFLVNDRVDIALAANADGVHLGVDDLPVAVARRLLGPNAVIGYSPETDADRASAEAAGIDYLGVGPFAGTTTKSDAGAAIGATGIQRVVERTALPVVAIGGISAANAGQALAAGACGVAVVGAVFLADDPAAAAATLAEVVP